MIFFPPAVAHTLYHFCIFIFQLFWSGTRPILPPGGLSQKVWHRKQLQAWRWNILNVLPWVFSLRTMDKRDLWALLNLHKKKNPIKTLWRIYSYFCVEYRVMLLLIILLLQKEQPNIEAPSQSKNRPWSKFQDFGPNFFWQRYHLKPVNCQKILDPNLEILTMPVVDCVGFLDPKWKLKLCIIYQSAQVKFLQ